MLRRIPDMTEQSVRDVGQHFSLNAGRGVAVLHTHIDTVQKYRTAVPLPPEGEQQGQGPGGLYMTRLWYDEDVL